MNTTNPSIPEEPMPGVTEFGEQLAMTGSETIILIILGCLLITLGFIAVYGSRRS
jgi:LPXTG-motif cell wall-anchored protein